MTEKRFTTKNIICSNYCVWDNNDKPYGNDEVVNLLNELYETKTNLLKRIEELVKENSQLKNINNQIDEELIDEEMTNMECLLLLIPFGILFILLTGIIIVFLVQLGWITI